MAAKRSITIRVLISLLFGVAAANAQYFVEVVKPLPHGAIRLVEKCDASGAVFGGNIIDYALRVDFGCAVAVVPETACPAPVHVAHNETIECEVPIAVAARSTPEHKCDFSEKAYNVQNAVEGFRLLIIYNMKGEEPFEMGGGSYASKVRLPVLMISYDCAQSVLQKYNSSEGYRIQVRVTPGYYDLIRYALPFVFVMGICFFLFILIVCIRICRERRRNARKRLSRRNLRKIPVRKFKAGDTPDTCAICLEDFIVGEKLRNLPCRHTYHCKCIDPWLTQNRKVCPMCKRRVGSGSDSDSGDENRPRILNFVPNAARTETALIENPSNEDASSAERGSQDESFPSPSSSRDFLVTDANEEADMGQGCGIRQIIFGQLARRNGYRPHTETQGEDGEEDQGYLTTSTNLSELPPSDTTSATCLLPNLELNYDIQSQLESPSSTTTALSEIDQSGSSPVPSDSTVAEKQ